MKFTIFFPLFLASTSLAQTNEKQIIEGYVKKIEEKFDNDISFKKDMMAASVRFVFHDCGPYNPDAPEGQKGGCTGCIPFNDPANRGLQKVQNKIKEIFDDYKYFSAPNAIDLFARISIDYASRNAKNGGTNLVDSFKNDKVEEKSCDYKKGRLPNHTHSWKDYSSLFDNLGMNVQDTVAILGAHTIGKAHKQNSGYDFSWDDTTDDFDNHYYKFLLNKEYYRTQTDDKKHVFKSWRNVEVVNGRRSGLLTCDASLVYHINNYDNDCQIMKKTSDKGELNAQGYFHLKNEELCQKSKHGCRGRYYWVKTFANNEQIFFNSFTNAFNTLTSVGPKK